MYLFSPHALIKLFLKVGSQGFKEFYGVEVDSDVDNVVECVGKKKGYLLKKGEIDEHRTCSMIVRDWQQGRLRL